MFNGWTVGGNRRRRGPGTYSIIVFRSRACGAFRIHLNIDRAVEDGALMVSARSGRSEMIIFDALMDSSTSAAPHQCGIGSTRSPINPLNPR